MVQYVTMERGLSIARCSAVQLCNMKESLSEYVLDNMSDSINTFNMTNSLEEKNTEQDCYCKLITRFVISSVFT